MPETQGPPQASQLESLSVEQASMSPEANLPQEVKTTPNSTAPAPPDAEENLAPIRNQLEQLAEDQESHSSFPAANHEKYTRRKITNAFNNFYHGGGRIFNLAFEARNEFADDPKYATYAAMPEDEIIKVYQEQKGRKRRLQELGYGAPDTDIPADVEDFVTQAAKKDAERAVAESHLAPKTAEDARKMFQDLLDIAKQEGRSKEEAYLATRYADILANRKFEAATTPVHTEDPSQTAGLEESSAPHRAVVIASKRTELGGQKESDIHEVLLGILEKSGEWLRSPDAVNLLFDAASGRDREKHTRFIMVRNPHAKGAEDLSVCIAVDAGRAQAYIDQDDVDYQTIIINFCHKKGFFESGESFVGRLILGNISGNISGAEQSDFYTDQAKVSGVGNKTLQQWDRGRYALKPPFSSLTYAGEGHVETFTSEDYKALLAVLSQGNVDSQMMKRVIETETGDFIKGKLAPDQSLKFIARSATNTDTGLSLLGTPSAEAQTPPSGAGGLSRN